MGLAGRLLAIRHVGYLTRRYRAPVATAATGKMGRNRTATPEMKNQRTQYRALGHARRWLADMKWWYRVEVAIRRADIETCTKVNNMVKFSFIYHKSDFVIL